jgi:hypothetical protein
MKHRVNKNDSDHGKTSKPGRSVWEEISRDSKKSEVRVSSLGICEAFDSEENEIDSQVRLALIVLISNIVEVLLSSIQIICVNCGPSAKFADQTSAIDCDDIKKIMLVTL